MIRSMTGFGKSITEVNEKKINIELRSVNSRQLDLNMRMPGIYREKESELKSEISKHLERGKVDLSIYVEYSENKGALSIDKKLAAGYHKELKLLAKQLGETKVDLLPMIMRMPDVIKNEKQEQLNDKEWKQVKLAFGKALHEIKKFREEEGNTLAKELETNIGKINQSLQKIVLIDKERIPAIREKLKKNILDFVEKEKIDQNRFEQELIYYIEKLDITEEKVRLKTHCDYFVKTMKEESSGRKLGFISQEIGREINTIGSKANNADIQKIVVEMKDELEKIKEQLSNIL